MPIEYVKIKHPKHGTSEVKEESLPVWQELGWSVDKSNPVAESNSEAPKKP